MALAVRAMRLTCLQGFIVHPCNSCRGPFDAKHKSRDEERKKWSATSLLRRLETSDSDGRVALTTHAIQQDQRRCVEVNILILSGRTEIVWVLRSAHWHYCKLHKRQRVLYDITKTNLLFGEMRQARLSFCCCSTLLLLIDCTM